MPTRSKTKATTATVTFELPSEIEADTLALCGEFNEWSRECILLERDGDSRWQTTVALEPGRPYRYRYLINGEHGENSWDADDYDYYWVPGTWVLAPEVGYLWTPAWWGWSGGAYLFHAGWWGPHVGFYGGISYGFGYFGHGYEGGRWDG